MEFEKININPKGIKTGDCVIRAIAYSMNKEWDEVYRDLCVLGCTMKRMPNEKQVYEKYLEKEGWTKHKQPKKANGSKMPLDLLAEILEIGCTPNRPKMILITMPGHMTCVEWTGSKMKLIDTWNCSTKNVGNYWTLDT